MAKFLGQSVMDAGLNYIRNNCNKIAVIGAYTAGASYATVNAAIIAEAAMAPADFTLGTSGLERTITSAAGKQDAAANTSASSAHIVFLNTTGSEVLWVTEETSAQAIVAGNPVTFPSIVMTAKQLTAP